MRTIQAHFVLYADAGCLVNVVGADSVHAAYATILTTRCVSAAVVGMLAA